MTSSNSTRFNITFNNYCQSMLQWNVRSISVRKLDLINLLFTHNCTFTSITETWLLPYQIFNILNYHLIRHDRRDGYGGFAIAIKRDISVWPIIVERNLLLQLEDLDINLVGVEVLSSLPLQLWFLYIPPHSNVTPNILDHNFNLVKTSNTIIARDLNAYHSSWGSPRSNFRGN